MSNAFDLAAGQPWLIQPEALETVLSIAQRQGDPEALATRLGRELTNSRKVTVRDGVAVVPVTGPIFRYANLFTQISGATSTGVLATDIQAAIDDPLVRAIVLDCDSPGGVATGISELADHIRAWSQTKRIVAYGGGNVASACYWLAAACSEIVISPTAVVGSIGVVMSLVSDREKQTAEGLRKYDIVSSVSPNKRVDPDNAKDRARVQAVVDAMADVFVDSVASFRGVSRDVVLSDFGQGGVMVGQQAVDAGLADRIGSLESVIAELAGHASASPKRNSPMSATQGQVTADATTDLQTPAADIVKNDAAAADTAQAQAVVEAAAGADATAAAVLGERQRIAKLNTLARAGFETELQAAIDNGTSPEAFALTLLTAAAGRGVTLEAIGRDAPLAASHARPGNEARTTTSTGLNARNVYAARAAATATK